VTSLDKRLYQALTEATDAVAGAAGERPNERLDDLLRDPDTRRCWREVVTGEDPLTLRGGRRATHRHSFRRQLPEPPFARIRSSPS